MAWSEKAIDEACAAYAKFEGPHCICVTAMRAALDAAAAVDGDAQREALAQFMIRHSFPTGHGDTHADLLVELDAAIQKGDDAEWNAAIEAAAQRAGEEFCGAFELIGDGVAAAIRSLKRLADRI